MGGRCRRYLRRLCGILRGMFAQIPWVNLVDDSWPACPIQDRGWFVGRSDKARMPLLSIAVRVGSFRVTRDPDE